MAIGFTFSKLEHKWERRTNISIVLGIAIVSTLYYLDHSYFRIPYLLEIAFSFLGLIAFCHLFARISHAGEQKFLKKFRPWRQ